MKVICQPRPCVPAGFCIKADCGKWAIEGDILCPEHHEFYRVHICACGRPLSTDASRDRGYCWKCLDMKNAKLRWSRLRKSRP